MDCYIEFKFTGQENIRVSWSPWFHVIALIVSLCRGFSWGLPFHFLLGPFYLIYAFIAWIVS